MIQASSLTTYEIQNIVDEAMSANFNAKVRLAVRLARRATDIYDAEDAVLAFHDADKVVAVWRSARLAY
jgi:hypothetical protein